MKYYVQYVSNGALQVDKITEWTDLSAAKSEWHKNCRTLWSTPDVRRAVVVILDNEFNVVEGYKDVITHEVAE